MRKRMKRSLWGYEKKSVERSITSLNEKHQEAKRMLEEKLAVLETEVRQLREKVEQLNRDSKEFKRKEREISDRLLIAHIEGTRKAAEALSPKKEDETKKKE